MGYLLNPPNFWWLEMVNWQEVHVTSVKKTWTNHSSDTILQFVQVFFKTDVNNFSKNPYFQYPITQYYHFIIQKFHTSQPYTL